MLEGVREEIDVTELTAKLGEKCDGKCEWMYSDVERMLEVLEEQINLKEPMEISVEKCNENKNKCWMLIVVRKEY